MIADPADLSNLRDIVLPAPVPYWPPAPGWLILGAALLACLLALAARLAGAWRRNAYRRAALRELDAIGSAEDAESAQRISAVLKRAALVAFPRAQVAPLTGEAWRAFLDRTADMNAFLRGSARRLTEISLGVAAGADAPIIVAAAKDWVRRHRTER